MNLVAVVACLEQASDRFLSEKLGQQHEGLFFAHDVSFHSSRMWDQQTIGISSEMPGDRIDKDVNCRQDASLAARLGITCTAVLWPISMSRPLASEDVMYCRDYFLPSGVHARVC